LPIFFALDFAETKFPTNMPTPAPMIAKTTIKMTAIGVDNSNRELAFVITNLLEFKIIKSYQ
jgi:hypothetical protein